MRNGKQMQMENDLKTRMTSDLPPPEATIHACIGNPPAALPTMSEAQINIRNLMVDADEDEDARLHLAAICGDEEGLRYLLHEIDSKLWINFRVRPFLATPLRLAVTGGSFACVKLLLSSGADVDLEDIKAQTPLFIATTLRNITIMEELLQSGANPLGCSRNLSTTVLLAVRDGFAEGLKLLLKYGASADPTRESVSSSLSISAWPLQHSIVYAHFSCYLALIQHGAGIHIKHLTENEQLIRRFSIPHAIAKYAKNYPEFVRLYHDMNGDLRQEGVKGTCIMEEFQDHSPSIKEMKRLKGMPSPLKSCCRRKLRQLMRGCFYLINHLDIPITLKSYLHFEEYSKYASRTKENLHVKLKTEKQEEYF